MHLAESSSTLLCFMDWSFASGLLSHLAISTTQLPSATEQGQCFPSGKGLSPFCWRRTFRRTFPRPLSCQATIGVALPERALQTFRKQHLANLGLVKLNTGLKMPGKATLIIASKVAMIAWTASDAGDPARTEPRPSNG